MTSEDGEAFIKNLAQFIRTHERALANALQIQQQRARQAASSRPPTSTSGRGQKGSGAQTSLTANTLATALSLGSLSFGLQGIKPAKLTLTPHHLFYLLSRFEELGVDVGSMNIRLENLTAEASPGNYVSFLSQPQRSRGRSDRDSIHSVSSVRSSMSNFSSFWSSLGLTLTNEETRNEKALAQMKADLTYLYSAFTKIPCLRLSPDRKARLIKGYEEFPFDSAVPLIAFKNVSSLEICDLDFRLFFGWDRMAEQLRSLTVKRGNLEDPLDLLVAIVLDDMDKRRRRSSKAQSPGIPRWANSPMTPRGLEYYRANSAPSSPLIQDTALGSSASPRNSVFMRGEAEITVARSHRSSRNKSASPARPGSSRPDSSYRHARNGGEKMKRTGSGSSGSSTASHRSRSRSRSSSQLLAPANFLPSSKWRFLRHLSLTDNGLTTLTFAGLAPVANTLQSLDISSNLFTEIPDCLAMLTCLRALDLSNCMINSLHSLARSPLPAISVLNLRANRLSSLAGIERIFSLERLDVRDNALADPTEIARLTGIPDMREVWVRGNPFVRSHSNYRIAIFNLFRGSPGYHEDIIIDAYGPGYNERRHLRDRTEEPVPETLVRPPSIEFDVASPIEIRKPNVEEEPRGTPSPRIRPPLESTQSEPATTSSRRKRVTKRRIVDLSADEIPIFPSQSLDKSSSRPMSSSFSASPKLDSGAKAPQNPQIQKLQGSGEDPFGPQLAPLSETATPMATVIHRPKSNSGGQPGPAGTGAALDSPLQMHVNGDAYRQKVQALKNEFGAGWLRVLTEQGWELPAEAAAKGLPMAATGSIRPTVTPMRAPSQGIVGGSRTLG